MAALGKIINDVKNLGFERVHKWCVEPGALFFVANITKPSNLIIKTRILWEM